MGGRKDKTSTGVLVSFTLVRSEPFWKWPITSPAPRTRIPPTLPQLQWKEGLWVEQGSLSHTRADNMIRRQSWTVVCFQCLVVVVVIVASGPTLRLPPDYWINRISWITISWPHVAFASWFLNQSNILYHNFMTHGFAHVINRESCHCSTRQGFHFHTWKNSGWS